MRCSDPGGPDISDAVAARWPPHLPDTEVPLHVVSASWEPRVRDRDDGTVNRAGYACCVLDQLRVGLRRRDVYVPGSTRILNRGESRNSLARDIFHGRRGQLRQPYQTGQEDQIGALGLMVNIVVLWQTVYIQATLDHLAALGHPIDPADVARLSPLGHPTVNLQGRYRTTSRAPNGGLRPLRTAERHG